MNAFTIEFVSRNEYEQLAVEISYRGQLLCEINAERGPEELEVEFAKDYRLLGENIELRFPVVEFSKAFEGACTALVTACGP